MDRIKCLIEQPGTEEEKKTSYDYCKDGLLKRVIKPDDVELLYEYDALGRRTLMTSSDNTINYRYEYNLHHDPILIKDKVHNFEHERKYDPWRRLRGEILLNNSVTMRYDPLGRITQFRAPDDSLVTYEYAEGRLHDVIRLSKHEKELYRHSYTTVDMKEHVLKSTLIGGCGKMSFDWDKKGRCVAISSTHYSQTIPEDGFDAVGNLKKLHATDTLGSVQSRFSYDDLYQLTNEKGAFEHIYEHDSLYNRLEDDGTRCKLDSANKLLQGKNGRFRYDKNGNLIKRIDDYSTTVYRYDALDRLIEAENGHFMARYIYDALNRRIRKECTFFNAETNEWSEPSRSDFIYLGDREVGSLDKQHTMKEFRVIGRGKGAEIGASVALELGNRIYCPIHDHRGNIVAAIDAETNVVIKAARYSAFGEALEWSEPEVNVHLPWGFASKRYDEETGFYYFGKRYYLPSIGRWVTPDPAGFADGPNLYAYVRNSPLMLFDPYGLSWMDDTKKSTETMCERIVGSLMSDSEDDVSASDPADALGPSLSDEEALHQTQHNTSWKDRAISAGIMAGSCILALPTGGASVATGSLVVAGRAAVVSTALRGACLATAKKVASRAMSTFGFMGAAVGGGVAGAATVVKSTAATTEQVVKNEISSLDTLSKAGEVMDRGSLTKAGRGLDKHGGRPGGDFPKATGNPAAKNAQGQYHLDDILTHPDSTITRNYRPRYGGDVIDVKIQNGRGVRYDKDGNFIGFLEP